jgi:hypothetical protein
LDDGAGFFDAQARLVASAVSRDALVKLGRKFFRRNLVPGEHKRLQELKSEVGSLGMRQDNPDLKSWC